MPTFTDQMRVHLEPWHEGLARLREPRSADGELVPCRFMATKDIQDAEVNSFLDVLTKKGWWWSAAQKLWNYNGEAGFSKAY